MDIKQKCGYILYFGKARKKLETRYRKARPARGPIHKSPSLPEARKIQAQNIANLFIVGSPEGNKGPTYTKK